MSVDSCVANPHPLNSSPHWTRSWRPCPRKSMRTDHRRILEKSPASLHPAKADVHDGPSDGPPKPVASALAGSLVAVGGGVQHGPRGVVATGLGRRSRLGGGDRPPRPAAPARLCRRLRAASARPAPLGRRGGLLGALAGDPRRRLAPGAAVLPGPALSLLARGADPGRGPGSLAAPGRPGLSRGPHPGGDLLGRPPWARSGRGGRGRPPRRRLRTAHLHGRAPGEGGDGRARCGDGPRPDRPGRRPGRSRVEGIGHGIRLGGRGPPPGQRPGPRAPGGALVGLRGRRRGRPPPEGAGPPLSPRIRPGDRARDGGQRPRLGPGRADPDHLARGRELLHRQRARGHWDLRGTPLRRGQPRARGRRLRRRGRPPRRPAAEALGRLAVLARRGAAAVARRPGRLAPPARVQGRPAGARLRDPRQPGHGGRPPRGGPSALVGVRELRRPAPARRTWAGARGADAVLGLPRPLDRRRAGDDRPLLRRGTLPGPLGPGPRPP